MRDSVPSASYSSVCNVLRQWSISLIPTYRVYRLYDKPRVVVTYFRLHHTCSIIIIIMASLTKWCYKKLTLQPTRIQPWHNNYKRVRENAHLFMSKCTSYVPTHIYIADMLTEEVSKCTVTSERSVYS